MEPILAFAHAHTLLAGGIVLVSLLIVANEIHAAVTGMAKIGTTAAVRLINDRDALVVDVRTAADFKRGHLLGALNLPAASLKDRAGELPKDKSRPIVVMCALGGATGAEAARTIKAMGYAEVFPLSGGLNAWVGASLPTTTR